MKAIAPHKDRAGYHALLEAYTNVDRRCDETVYTSDAVERFARALKKRGVSGKVLEDAMRDAAA